VVVEILRAASVERSSWYVITFIEPTPRAVDVIYVGYEPAPELVQIVPPDLLLNANPDMTFVVCTFNVLKHKRFPEMVTFETIFAAIFLLW
jgi:hypothetical protein